MLKEHYHEALVAQCVLSEANGHYCESPSLWGIV
jgi:hypothetical protein